MTTSDVHVPPFEPLSTAVTRAPAPVPSYYPHHNHHRLHHPPHRHHPYYRPLSNTFQSSATDPTLYSLNNHSTTTRNIATVTAAATIVNNTDAQPRMVLCSNSRSNTSYTSSAAGVPTPAADADAPVSTAINNTAIASSEQHLYYQQQQQQQPAITMDDDTRPCEKYRQFLHSNHQERSVMIDKLVDVAAEIIDSIWYPLKDSKVVTTRNFIQEILKRSKATYLTLQISLFYLFRVKKRVHERLQTRRLPSPPLSPPPSTLSCSPADSLGQEVCHQTPHQKKDRTEDIMLCGRRMFLASLMVASKYLQDKNYRNKAWAKIAGLDLAEINAAELAFLCLIDYKLYISKPTFDKWYTLIHGLVQKKQEQVSAVAHAINTNV